MSPSYKIQPTRIIKRLFLTVCFAVSILSVFSQKSRQDDRKLLYNKYEKLIIKKNYDEALKIIDTLNQRNLYIYNFLQELKGYIYSRKYEEFKNQQDCDSSLYCYGQVLSFVNKKRKWYNFHGYIKSELRSLADISYNKALDALGKGNIDSAEYYFSGTKRAMLLINPSNNPSKYDGSFLFSKFEAFTKKGDYDSALKIVDTLNQYNIFEDDYRLYLKGNAYCTRYETIKKLEDYDSSLYCFAAALSLSKEKRKWYHFKNSTKNYVIENLQSLAEINYDRAADALDKGNIDSAEYYFLRAKKATILSTPSSVPEKDIQGMLLCDKFEVFTKKGYYNNALKIVDTLNQRNLYTPDYRLYLKGYAYSIKYKSIKNIQDCDSSLYCFAEALSLMKERKQKRSHISTKDDIIANLQFLANMNHNRAGYALDKGNLDSAEYYFSRTQKAMLLIAPSRLPEKDKEFYLACGSVCGALYEADMEKNQPYFQKGLNYYEKVLLLDSNNYSAVYNISILYYNKAVRDLKKAKYCKQVEAVHSIDWSNPGTILPSIEKLLECLRPEEFEKYSFTPAFKKALPYALKAYQIAPTNKHILEALVGITYITRDTKSYNKYEQELQKLN